MSKALDRPDFISYKQAPRGREPGRTATPR